MAIKSYTKVIDGKNVTLYSLKVDTFNRLTGLRLQKFVSGFTSEAAAVRSEREIWNSLRNERPEFLKTKTWGNLVDLYLDEVSRKERGTFQGGYSPKVIATKAARLKHTGGWNRLDLRAITAGFVKNELDEMERSRGVSRNQTSAILKECKATLYYAVDVGLMETNPLTRIARKAPKKKKQCFTLEEANKFLFEAKRQEHPFYSVWLISIFTGLRRSELAGLKWTDIDWEHRMCQVERQMIPFEGLVSVPKDLEDRIIPINQNLLLELKKLRLKSTSEFVISFDDSSWAKRRWERGEQSAVIREFCRKIGLKEITHHQLRATFITLALADNIALGKVKEIAGHSSLEITDIYFRRAGLNLRGVTDTFSVKIPPDGGELIPLVAISSQS